MISHQQTNVIIRVLVDVELRITSGHGKHHTSNSDMVQELDIEKHVNHEILLLEKGKDAEDLLSVSRLSKPVWPKSSPTIPSALFKDDYSTKVPCLFQ